MNNTYLIKTIKTETSWNITDDSILENEINKIAQNGYLLHSLTQIDGNITDRKKIYRLIFLKTDF